MMVYSQTHSEFISMKFFSKWRCPFARRQNGFDVCQQWHNSTIKIDEPLHGSISSGAQSMHILYIKFYIAHFLPVKNNNSIWYSILSNCDSLQNDTRSRLLRLHVDGVYSRWWFHVRISIFKIVFNIFFEWRSFIQFYRWIFCTGWLMQWSNVKKKSPQNSKKSHEKSFTEFSSFLSEITPPSRSSSS